MDAYDASAERLRRAVEKAAEELSRRLQQAPSDVDLLGAVEDAAQGLVGLAQDAVNAAVDGGRRYPHIVQDIGCLFAATENLVTVIEGIVHEVRAIHHAHAVTLEIFQVVTDAHEMIGGFVAVPEAGRTPGIAAGASADELIQARRAAIRAQKTALAGRTRALRDEIKAKLAAIAAKSLALRPPGR